ncbi:MAG TPA: hypothetical protein VFI29_03770 [Hanamia sp.]|nr:hypothetical protein [Hanamia sp.]
MPDLEYYGSVDGLFNFLPFQQQQQQLFAVIDINAWANWKLNFGYAHAFTNAVDNGIKCL